MVKGNRVNESAMTEPTRVRDVDVSDQKFGSLLHDRSSEFFENVLSKAFNSRRDFLVHAIAKKLRSIGLGSAPAEPDSGSSSSERWIEIESLSRLRSVVGGRFQNIKDKWVNAGFPLREHRGDKSKGFEVEEKAWIELSNWILKQGFEARLTPHKPNCLFELKSVSNK